MNKGGVSVVEWSAGATSQSLTMNYKVRFFSEVVTGEELEALFQPQARRSLSELLALTKTYPRK